jgi:hypothetical protein
MALTPSAALLTTPEDLAAADAAEARIDAALPQRTTRTVIFRVRADPPKEAAAAFELGAVSFVAMNVVAARYIAAGWHVYVDFGGCTITLTQA